jgi:Cys-tRNA(Pro)/Cys-tRNA(Cys) deacylase
MKTNAARLLDRLGIRYELRDYDVDPNDLSAEAVAAKIGVPLQEVWKTLIVRGDRQGICFAVVAGGDEIDLKALARLTGDRSAALVALKEVQPLTGYVRGGVTALGGKKDFPVFVEDSMQRHARVAVSAGVRGTQILIAPADYIRATNATVGQFRRAL